MSTTGYGAPAFAAHGAAESAHAVAVGRWVRLHPDSCDDGRGYRLRHVDGRYVAGCRNFTAEQAIGHWSNPGHPAPESAARLLAAVQAHIAGGAL